MSIRTWWEERSKEISRVRKVRFIAHMHEKMEAIQIETNDGRLRHLVYNLSPDVRSMTSKSGGWGRSSVEITMSDHFTINVYDHWFNDALKDAAIQIYERVMEKKGIPSLWELK